MIILFNLKTYYSKDPNIGSALNHHAAELWSNQVLYKKYLIDKYEKDVKKSGNSSMTK